MNAPLAVIAVTYSPGAHLEKFVRSVPAALPAGTSALTILADNGSTDGAPERAAAADEAVELHVTGGNIGYGGAINSAARLLRQRRADGEIDGEFFLISNPDVVFEPGSIATLLECARRHPRAGAVGPLIVEADGSIYPSARAIPTLANGIGHALFGSVWPANPWTAAYKDNADMSTERTAGWLSGSCLLVRWEAFDAIGGFDERYFMYMEDVDFGDRLTAAGWDNVLCPEAKISHAKGHAAGKLPETMLPAHHESAFRFQADRLSGAVRAPLRAALWLGLKARSTVAVAQSRRQQGRHS